MRRRFVIVHGSTVAEASVENWRHDELAGRNPTLSSRLPGSFALRYAERQFLALLIQEPPRSTR